MTFRADEAARVGYEEVEHYFVTRQRDVDASQRARSKEALRQIVDELGPVIARYPTWHPLVCNHDIHNTVTTPSERCGYEGLDHTRYFANGFLTCPYDDGQRVMDSVAELQYHPIARITAERLDVQFYTPEATPILVRCIWNDPIPDDGMVPLSVAMPLLLENEIPSWRSSQVAETWETMRPYFLGVPHGRRSSLFVSQETGQAMKKVWEALIYTGMFGPIKV